MLWANVLPALGLIEGDEFALNGLISYSLVSGVVMTFLMQLRANQLKKSNLQFSQDLLLSKQQVEMEKIKREEQSQLLDMLIHELKNPLAVIDLAQHADINQESRNYVTRNVTIIKDILDRCLNADRISNGKLVILREPVDLRLLVEEVLADQNDATHRLQWHPSSQRMVLSTDAQCVRIVLNNLIGNALRYGDTTQPVQVKMDWNPDHSAVCIKVLNKPGVAGWPDADKLFQKYYRSPGAKSVSGTGLGLFLVASITKVLGATCRYHPDEKNICFELCIPH
jgi:two-component system, sensor histidine kinase LadS